MSDHIFKSPRAAISILIANIVIFIRHRGYLYNSIGLDNGRYFIVIGKAHRVHYTAKYQREQIPCFVCHRMKEVTNTIRIK